jgi:hypothetical protein
MIFKIFLAKNSAKKMAFLTQSKAKLCKNLIITLVFEKNAFFSFYVFYVGMYIVCHRGDWILLPILHFTQKYSSITDGRIYLLHVQPFHAHNCSTTKSVEKN